MFSDLGVSAELVGLLAKRQITEPTPIQSAALPVLAAGHDAYLHAETGTGKTLAYVLPLLARLRAASGPPQVIIVAPTHELAIQIQRECTLLGQLMVPPVRTVLLIGGTPLDRQLEKLKRKPQIVVGSPGRIRDLITNGRLKPHNVIACVVDEADRLMTEESRESITAIIQAAPRTRQLIFASATVHTETTAAIEALAPHLVMLQPSDTPVNPAIEHSYVVCAPRDKADTLRQLWHALQPERAMVFVHRAETAEVVAGKLTGYKIPVADLHGSYAKADRQIAMEGFRSGAVPVLIVSDVAARGLDIKGVTHVFNLDVPTQSKAYLHRVGRTGRAGMAGHAVSIMDDGETRLVARYERELGIVMHRMKLRYGQLIPFDAPDDPRR